MYIATHSRYSSVTIHSTPVQYPRHHRVPIQSVALIYPSFQYAISFQSEIQAKSLSIFLQGIFISNSERICSLCRNGEFQRIYYCEIIYLFPSSIGKYSNRLLRSCFESFDSDKCLIFEGKKVINSAFTSMR